MIKISYDYAFCILIFFLFQYVPKNYNKSILSPE